MSSPIPPGFDPQASLDAALFASAGGSSTSSSDPAVDALDQLGSSYGDEISFLQQQQLQPSSGAYDETGSLVGGSSGDSEAAQLQQTLSNLLGGDSSSSTVDALMTETAGAGASAEEQLFDGAMPALAYDSTGSLLDSGSTLLDLLG